MSVEEKIAFRMGYQKALKETLDDLAQIHSTNPNDIPVRSVVDQIWNRVKRRLSESKAENERQS